MLNDKLKNYLHLHFLVFIAGFTAILGELITISAVPLVWFRMLMAIILISLFVAVTKTKIKLPLKSIAKLSIAGVVIASHWITFFGAIEISNISITLAMFSTGAFFASLIEPIIFKRKIIWYEMLFGFIVIIGVSIITQSEMRYISGILLGIFSAFLSSLFAVLNGKFLEKHQATTISFYEFISGVAFLTIFLMVFYDGFSVEFFQLSTSDYIYLFILASVCTAYAFIASVHVMRYLSPYTVVLTYNLEPIYGIILAIILFPEKEIMSTNFYIGSSIILGVVLLNGILKNKNALKRKKITY
ncbi:DMT family transporter [Oceanihabitans sediminis]|uniref:DMT family transporter n=1 Tax=Oceanihabitans sediminis TaxID=1812012 RepID=A0A368P4M4_9FLAO|nr:DMT family transporter [Oceanihabitans sediminis]MDX1277436.1 DMT family transporter [Oceanihabitans sediminis]MDX1774233.1 DMT family transporter [Oceanihabitans sediminis]RBP30757.1 EamA-like transporter family protein [Oceanihabitans sediminis]RCU56729.1 DMT family transporter [Oceanihabitans sediminis]